jgi:hypothetical protein
VNTLRRWYATVCWLMNSRSPISEFDRPSPASRATCACWASPPEDHRSRPRIQKFAAHHAGTVAPARERSNPVHAPALAQREPFRTKAATRVLPSMYTRATTNAGLDPRATRVSQNRQMRVGLPPLPEGAWCICREGAAARSISTLRVIALREEQWSGSVVAVAMWFRLALTSSPSCGEGSRARRPTLRRRLSSAVR